MMGDDESGPSGEERGHRRLDDLFAFSVSRLLVALSRR